MTCLFRSTMLGALLPISVAFAASSDQLQWFSVSTPGQSALYRADAGLVGQDESPSMLLDLCARGGSYTGIDLLYQTDEATVGQLHWKRPAVDFGLETAVEALPGLVFGLDAIDHYPKTVASDGTSQWELFDPQGGLRVGGGFDLLRAMRDKSDWRWVVAGWLPVFSQTREWELRSGVIWARKLRLDVSATWSTPGIASNWTLPVDTTSAQDTLWWRADQSRYTIRIGGAPTKSVSLQAWTGTRELRDPGAGDQPSWRTWGRSWFGGAQAGFQAGFATWDLEARGEQGHQSLLFDGSRVFASYPDSGIVRSSTDFTLGSGRAKASASVTESVGLGLELSSAWRDLENASLAGTPLPPASGSSGSWSSTKRVSAVLSVPAKFPWLEIEPSIGLQWRAQDGQPVPVWQEMAPFSQGRSWSIPVGLQLSRRGLMNGKIAYTLSGEIELSGTHSPEPGFRHHLEMKQGF